MSFAQIVSKTAQKKENKKKITKGRVSQTKTVDSCQAHTRRTLAHYSYATVHISLPPHHLTNSYLCVNPLLPQNNSLSISLSLFPPPSLSLSLSVCVKLGFHTDSVASPFLFFFLSLFCLSLSPKPSAISFNAWESLPENPYTKPNRSISRAVWACSWDFRVESVELI